MGGETKILSPNHTSSNGPSPRGRGNRDTRARHRGQGGSIPAWAGKPRRIRRPGTTHGVHPRVGGETDVTLTQSDIVGGPSPRGRGNLRPEAAAHFAIGSIPAWAGKPEACCRSCPSTWVHPRVGGETPRPPVAVMIWSGPSPRGRGNRGLRHERMDLQRSIPAWAGKPWCATVGAVAVRVHPRVGGETRLAEIEALLEPGPSPRGRGNRLRRAGVPQRRGSIPAWAGKPPAASQSGSRAGVHPRVGGETKNGWGCKCYTRGPSPRGRGNPKIGFSMQSFLGSIPAWAGKPIEGQHAESGCWVHPRVGGETGWRVGVKVGLEGPSPRGRGNLPEADEEDDLFGSIPAWAGKPGTQAHSHRPRWVHPRVGGETTPSRIRTFMSSGPSPRGRGNQRELDQRA